MRGVKPYLAVDNGEGDMLSPPEPPEWIGESGGAEWRRIVPDLVKRGRLNEADLGAVESYCLAVGRVRDMQKMIAREGAVTVDAKGLPKKHPAIGIQKDALAIARLLAAELGLTPVSRARPSNKGNDDGGGDLFAGMDY